MEIFSCMLHGNHVRFLSIVYPMVIVLSWLGAWLAIELDMQIVECPMHGNWSHDIPRHDHNIKKMITVFFRLYKQR